MGGCLRTMFSWTTWIEGSLIARAGFRSSGSSSESELSEDITTIWLSSSFLDRFFLDVPGDGRITATGLAAFLLLSPLSDTLLHFPTLSTSDISSSSCVSG